MNIIPFQSPDFSVRVVEIEGEPWFVGKDVAEALGYSDTVNAIKQHCRGVVNHHPIQDSLGRMQETRIISEPDLFRLVVNSQLPSAERFERWVFDDVLPSIRKTGGYQVGEPIKQATDAAKMVPPIIRAARALGLDKNAAAISANQYVRKLTGVNLLEEFGATHLVAENQEAMFFTASELGKMLPGEISGRRVNLLLAEAGMQAKRGEVWEVLEPGREFSRIYDTGKKHGSGVPVQQIKWAATVLPLLRQEEVA